jgi:RNA ligase
VSTVQTCRHPARLVDFQDLVDRLEAARAEGYVYRRDDAATGRSLYCYTSRCVYETAWDDVTVLARGLVVDRAAKRLIATPFPKFFNVGEGGRTIPDLPFEAFEKLDGSLAILHYHGGRWRAVTKGDFQSDQAKSAEAWLDVHDLTVLMPGTTYLAEAVHPGNRIVVRYEQVALVLLAAYDETGLELSYDQVMATAAALGWPVAQRYAYAAFADMLLETRALPRTAEGFVIRQQDGQPVP